MYPTYQPYQNQLQSLQNQFSQLAQPITPPQQPPIQYVNGRQSVDAYQLMPNQSALLMDNSMDRFYIKTADASGSCTVKSYDFKEATDTPTIEYVTKAEFEELKTEVSKLTAKPKKKGELDE